MNTLLLGVKAAKIPDSALKERKSVEVRKNPDYKMWKKQIWYGMGEDPDFETNIFIKKNVRIHLNYQFWRRSRLTEVNCMLDHINNLKFLHQHAINLSLLFDLGLLFLLQSCSFWIWVTKTPE